MHPVALETAPANEEIQKDSESVYPNITFQLSEEISYIDLKKKKKRGKKEKFVRNRDYTEGRKT